MDENIPISQKRGFPTNSPGGILVKADMSTVTKVFTEYFGFKVYSDCSEQKYLKLHNDLMNKQSRLDSIIRKTSGSYQKKAEKKLANLPCIFVTWKFYNHRYSILGFNGTCDDIAYAFATLLNTDVFIYDAPKHDYCNELKLFRGDKLVEHYMFGCDCGRANDDYWDIMIDFNDLNRNLISHRFCSSIRQITEEEIHDFVAKEKKIGEDYIFLDSCVKYYDAYFPDEEETPSVYLYYCQKSHLINFRNSIEQMNIIFIPGNCNYRDWKVPQQVIKD